MIVIRRLLLIQILVLLTTVGFTQSHGALLFYGIPTGNDFHCNNIIEISDHEIIFDLRVDHAIDALWTHIGYDLNGIRDSIYSEKGGLYLMKANFKDRTLKAVRLQYHNNSATNIYLVKEEDDIYYIDPEVTWEDSMEFAGSMQTFAIAKGSKVIMARFDTDLNLIDFKDWIPPGEPILGNTEKASVVVGDVVITENLKGTRTRYKVEHAIATTIQVSGSPSYVTALTKADRWGSVLSRHQHNQNGTFDVGLYLSANGESLTNQQRVYSVNQLNEGDLSVDTLRKFVSNAVFSSICEGKEKDQKYVAGYFQNSLEIDKSLVYQGKVRPEPYHFVASLNADTSLTDFVVLDSIFSSTTLSSVDGYPVISVSRRQGNRFLEHYLIDENGALTQRTNEFNAGILQHHFSVPMSSGAIASSSLVSVEVHNIGNSSYYNIDQMHVISLSSPLRPPPSSTIEINTRLVSCDTVLIDWPRTDADFYTVMVSEDSIPDFLPVDGENYNYAPNYALAYKAGAKTRVLYQGKDTTLNAMGFVSGRKYFLHVIEGTGPAGATQYASDARATKSFSIAASVWSEAVSILPNLDTAFCKGNRIVFKGNGASNYQWQNGIRGASVVIDQSQDVNFVSRMPDGCLVSSDTVSSQLFVTPLLTDLILWEEPPFCEGDTVQITGRSILTYGYQWSTGDTIPTIWVTEGGNYSLTSTDGPCSITKSITINLVEPPKFRFTTDTFNFLYGKKKRLDLDTEASQWNWKYGNQEGENTAVNIDATVSDYLVISGAEQAPCFAIDSAYINVHQPDTFIMPNAFSPNCDGLNDIWDVSSFYQTPYQVKVFDRWGEVLYVGDETTGGWDGYKHGDRLISGTYFYVLTTEKTDKVSSGPLFIIR